MASVKVFDVKALWIVMGESKTPIEEGEDDQGHRDNDFCWKKEFTWSADIVSCEYRIFFFFSNTYEYQLVHSGRMEIGMVVEIFPRFH